MIEKTWLFKRLIALAKRLAKLTDELIGVRGELVDIAEAYESEHKLCVRCGAQLDNELRCPECSHESEAK